jgi:hypothetical protein
MIRSTFITVAIGATDLSAIAQTPGGALSQRRTRCR